MPVKQLSQPLCLLFTVFPQGQVPQVSALDVSENFPPTQAAHTRFEDAVHLTADALPTAQLVHDLHFFVAVSR